MIRLLLALLLALWPAAAAASDTYSLAPTQDTEIRQNGGGTSNCGGCTSLITRAHSTGHYRALYQFDISSIPASSTLVSATLRLWVRDNEYNSVSIHRITQAWTEYGVTWANSGGVAHDAASAGAFTPSTPGRYHDIDVTALVALWRSGTANRGVLLKMSGNNAYASFTSREWGNAGERPQLVIVATPAPSFTAVSSSSVVSDPFNGTVTAKRIPGAILARSLVVTNSSSGSSDANSVAIVARVPSRTRLFVRDLGATGSGPVSFTQGSPSSQLSYAYSSLASTTDDLAFSNDGGVSFGYTPVPDATGYDAAVTHLRIAPKGTFAGTTGSGNPGFTLGFRVKVD